MSLYSILCIKSSPVGKRWNLPSGKKNAFPLSREKERESENTYLLVRKDICKMLVPVPRKPLGLILSQNLVRCNAKWQYNHVMQLIFQRLLCTLVPQLQYNNNNKNYLVRLFVCVYERALAYVYVYNCRRVGSN